MAKLFDPDSSVMQVVAKIGKLVPINVLWILCCLPVITIGASTTAMYRCTISLVRDMPCGVKVFFKAFAQNFWQSTVVWLVEAVFLASIYLNVSICLSTAEVSGTYYQLAISVIPAILVLFVSAYIYALIAQFDNKLKNYFINATVMSFKHFKFTLPMIIMNVLPLVFFLIFGFEVSVFYVGYLWVLIAFSGIAFLNSRMLVKIFDIYIEKEHPTEVKQPEKVQSEF